jgi:pyridoxine 5-phosphate synthase
MIHLGVNIDHIATLRNARGGDEPSVIDGAFACARGGADSITIHLREDRRHIRDEDLKLLSKTSPLPINLEMSIDPDIANIAIEHHPSQVTLVPEKREERTTESGIDVIKHLKHISDLSDKFREKGIRVSLFVDPDPSQLHACLKTSSRHLELHTGTFANAKSDADRRKEIARLEEAAVWCLEHGFTLHAGHGLNYHNTKDILHLPGLKELNIGHSIISRSIMTGLEPAVRNMRELMNGVETKSVQTKFKETLEKLKGHSDKT